MKLTGWKEIDDGWFVHPEIGGVRRDIDGWTVLPKWLPDSPEHDIGPFSSARYAKSVAEKRFEQHRAAMEKGSDRHIRLRKQLGGAPWQGICHACPQAPRSHIRTRRGIARPELRHPDEG